jgi:hypothetical protein
VTGPSREVEEGATSRAMDLGGAGDPIGTPDRDGVGAGSEVDPVPGSSCAATPRGEEPPPGELGVKDPRPPAALPDGGWDAEGIAPDPEADCGAGASSSSSVLFPTGGHMK